MPMTNEAPLNESQQAAVECIDAPSLVIAGAGSGKTRVLTYKVAYLLEHGYEPWNILALTFTNKAAKEMRDRIGRLVGEERARLLWMGTFHSIFARILRFEAEVMGYTSDYTIYDAQDAQSVVKQIIKELALDDKKYKPGVVASRISEAKNNMVTSRAYEQNRQVRSRDDASQMSEISRIYAIYDQRLRQSNAMDFDDLLLNTYRLFEEHPDIRDKYQDRFRFVLVDEYQDTNRVQHYIIRQLTSRNQRVCVVGDDAQSIYSFRGARIDNILGFRNLYPDTRLFKLERNYRSTQTIVGAAGSLIDHNQRQIHKEVYSKKDEGEPIEICEVYSDKEEASLVARKISELRRRQTYAWEDIAILYRTNSQSRIFEEEFRKQGFPYRIVGGLSFYQRKEVKDAIAYLRLAVNPHDESALRRVINTPARGIGQTTLDKVGRCAVAHDVSLWEVISSPADYELDVNAGTAQRLTDFAQMIGLSHERTEQDDAHTVAIGLIRQSGLWNDIFSSHEPEDISRQENLQELADGIASFVDEARESGTSMLLADYLQDISLLSDLEEGGDESLDRLTLMTAHAAKGLEFRAVFVVGMEEGLFPSEMSFDTNNVEEERRLFYVAMTRAEERLFLTWSHSRMRYGKFENNQKSRFLNEIDRRYIKGGQTPRTTGFGADLFRSSRRPVVQRESPSIHVAQPSGLRRVTPVRNVMSSFTASAPLSNSTATLKVGDRVEHARFGLGRIRAIEGSGLDTKATVEFDNVGTKQLLLRFAKLTPVS